MIKDSGERIEFSTGAVRDMKDGKGRFDLLPWYGIMEVSKHCEEGAKKYGEHNVDRGIPLHSLMDSASRHLAKFIAGESDEDHLRAAAWNILWALNQRTTHPELNDMYWAKKDVPKNVKAKETEYAYSSEEVKIKKCDEISLDDLAFYNSEDVDVMHLNCGCYPFFLGTYKVGTDADGEIKLYMNSKKCVFGSISIEVLRELGMKVYKHSKKESQASLYVRLTYKELRTMMGKMVYVASVLANVENGSYKVLVFGTDDNGKVELIPDKNLSAPYNKLTLIGDKSENDIEVYKIYESKD